MRRMWMLLLVVTLMVIVLAVPAMARVEADYTGCECAQAGRDEDGNAICVTGCPGKDEVPVEWTAWTSTNSLPTTTGSYYLTGNVTLTGQQSIKKDEQIIYLDLNGYTVQNKSTSLTLRLYRFFDEKTDGSNSANNAPDNCKLVITDSHGDGSMKNTGRYDQGGILWCTEGTNNFVTLYAGKMDGTNYIAKATPTNNIAGSILQFASGFTFNMYGGSILGSTVEDPGDYSQALVGPVVTSGNFYLHAGEIRGGYFEADTYSASGTMTNAYGGGGAVLITGGTFTMNGGTIYGGTGIAGTKVDGTTFNPVGGAIFLNSGTLNLSGGTIDGGSAYEGGAIYVSSSGKLNLDGGTIDGGSAYEGGCIYVKGTVNITGTTIQNGTTTYYGGNICQNGGTVNMTGGTIKDGVATGGDYYAGNVAVKGGTFNMKKDSETGSTGTISGGEAKKNGGSVNIGTGGTFKMEAGTITGGVSSDQGGNIWNAGTMIITGGTIENGEANRGGNIAMSSAKTTNSITGAKITGGIAKTEGGNIAVNSTNSVGTLTIGAGTTITGGIAPKNGRNVYISNNTAGGSTSWATTVIIKDGAQITQGDSESTCVDVYVQTAAKDGVEQNVYFNIVGSADGTRLGKVYIEDTVTFTCDGYAVNYYEVVYDDLATAVNDVTADDGDYITLAADYEGTLAVTENLNLDLNGHTVALSPASDVKIKLFNSSAADYTVGTGKATGGTASNYEQVFLTGSMTNYGHNYRFVTIQEDDGSFTAHRIYLAVKSTDLIPGAAPTVKHSIVLRCDSTLASLLNNSGSTYGLAVNGNSFDAISLANYAVEAYDADEGVENAVRYGVVNILGEDGNQTYGESGMSAKAFMSFTDAKGNAYSITSASSTARSLKDMVGLVNTAAGDADQVAAMSAALQAKLGEMYSTWNAKMTEWSWSIDNLAQFVTTAE